MNCPNCGVFLLSSAKVCDACGAEIISLTQPENNGANGGTPGAGQTVPQNQNAPQPSVRPRYDEPVFQGHSQRMNKRFPDSVPQNDPPAPAPKKPPKQPRGGGSKVGKIVGIIVLGLVIIGGVGYVLGNGKKNNDSEKTSGTENTALESSQDLQKSTTEVVHQETVLDLEVVDSYCYMPEKSSGDKRYSMAVIGLKNPNKSLVAIHPKATVTMRNAKGEIVGTGEQVGSIILPQDTVYTCVMVSIYESDYSDDITWDANINSEMSETFTTLKGARTTDFTFSNVSRRKGKYSSKITGELTSSFNDTLSDVQIIVTVVDNDNYPIFVSFTFVSDVGPGQTYPFEFDLPSSVPESDSIILHAVEWY